jgi:hypothetical protein
MVEGVERFVYINEFDMHVLVPYEERLFGSA